MPSVSGVARNTLQSGATSASICRQLPQGVPPVAVMIATAIKGWVAPLAIALATAEASAQIVLPNAAFSMLHPLKIEPRLSIIDAPTGKLEYGQWECFIASSAAVNSADWSLECDIKSALYLSFSYQSTVSNNNGSGVIGA